MHSWATQRPKDVYVLLTIIKESFPVKEGCSQRDTRTGWQESLPGTLRANDLHCAVSGHPELAEGFACPCCPHTGVPSHQKPSRHTLKTLHISLSLSDQKWTRAWTEARPEVQPWAPSPGLSASGSSLLSRHGVSHSPILVFSLGVRPGAP